MIHKSQQDEEKGKLQENGLAAPLAMTVGKYTVQ